MTDGRIDDGPENDPTGVRALLSALPDPGPMPDDLVLRIEARLAQETLAEPAAAATTTDITSLTAHRERRRPGRTLVIMGSAAAGLVAITVALSQLGTGLGQYDQTAGMGNVPATERDEGFGAADRQPGEDSDDADEPAADIDTSLDSDQDFDSEAEEGMQSTGGQELHFAGTPVVLPSLGELTIAEFGSAITAAADAHQAGSAVAKNLNPTVAQAISCFSSLSLEDHYDEYYIASAAWRRGDAMVLLARNEAAEGFAWLVPASCTEDSTVSSWAVVVVR